MSSANFPRDKSLASNDEQEMVKLLSGIKANKERGHPYNWKPGQETVRVFYPHSETSQHGSQSYTYYNYIPSSQPNQFSDSSLHPLYSAQPLESRKEKQFGLDKEYDFSLTKAPNTWSVKEFPLSTETRRIGLNARNHSVAPSGLDSLSQAAIECGKMVDAENGDSDYSPTPGKKRPVDRSTAGTKREIKRLRYGTIDGTETFPLPKGLRRQRAEAVMENEELRKYDEEYGIPVRQNGHLLKAFRPNGKRRCGVVCCLQCKACFCYVVLGDEPIAASLRSIICVLTENERKKITEASVVIRTYFDAPCRGPELSVPTTATTLQELGKILNMHSGESARDAHSLCQNVKREKSRRGEDYVNVAKPLSKIPGYYRY